MFNNVPIDVCTTAKLFDHCCLLIITLKRYRPTNRQLQYRSPYPISIRGVRWKDISVTEQCRTSIQIILLVHGYAALNLKSSFRLLFRTIQLFYFFTIPLLFHAIQLCIPWRNDF